MPKTKMEDAYTLFYDDGYQAFSQRESLLILPKEIPSDLEEYIKYQKDKAYNMGWIDAKYDRSRSHDA